MLYPDGDFNVICILNLKGALPSLPKMSDERVAQNFGLPFLIRIWLYRTFFTPNDVQLPVVSQFN